MCCLHAVFIISDHGCLQPVVRSCEGSPGWIPAFVRACTDRESWTDFDLVSIPGFVYITGLLIFNFSGGANGKFYYTESNIYRLISLFILFEFVSRIGLSEMTAQNNDFF